MSERPRPTTMSRRSLIRDAVLGGSAAISATELATQPLVRQFVAARLESGIIFDSPRQRQALKTMREKGVLPKVQLNAFMLLVATFPFALHAAYKIVRSKGNSST